MSIKLNTMSILYLLCICLFLFPVNAKSALFCHNSKSDSVIQSNEAILASAMLVPPSNIKMPFPFPSHKHTKKGGFLAVSSFAAGIIGIIIGSLSTVPLILLLGLYAGVAGQLGVKTYKHQKTYKVLSIVGIVLGAILVLFATIPLLFLL